MAGRTDARGVVGRSLALVLCALLTVTVVGGQPVRASEDPLPTDTSRPSRRGVCSDRATWRFRVRPGPEDTWRLRLIIDATGPDQPWHLFLSHDGDLFVSRTRKSDDLGDILLRRRRADNAGEDRFRFAAHNTRTFETCKGSVRVSV